MAPFGIGRRWQDTRGVGNRVSGEALVLRGDSGYSALKWWTSSVWLHVTAPGIAPAAMPGTALVVSRSQDPGGNRSGTDDYNLPCSPYGGLVADSFHDYVGWLLLCVVAPSGSRYGVHVRKTLRRGHLGPVLPVAIHPDRPADIEIPWRYAPDMTRALAEQLQARADAVPGTADRVIAATTAAADRALGGIEDPAVRARTEEMLKRFGMASGTGAPVESKEE